MKKWIYILAVIFLQMQFASCTDDLVEGSSGAETTSLKIMLDIPVENAQSRGLIYGPDEAAEAKESIINDIYALAFTSSGSFISKLNTQYSSSGTLYAILDTEAHPEAVGNQISVMILTNLNSQENGSALINAINSATGKTKAQVLESLKYAFTGKWDINTRQLPMWGEIQITPQEGQVVNGSVKLFRAVSKINVTVNKGDGVTSNGVDVFKLKSVRVYYARTSGLAGSKYAPVANPEGSPTIIEPSMPANVTYMPRYLEGTTTPNNILFEASPNSNYAIENQIYIPEAKQPGGLGDPTCLVVGGYYMGSPTETFYRVDFKQGNKGSVYYDAIRNHIYNFDITGVNRPGTDEPDPALDHVVVGMNVTITPWTTQHMRGIGGQYTLEVEAPGVLLASTNQSGNTLWVETTHNGGWSLESKTGDWYNVVKAPDGSGVIITPNLNNGGQRRGSFVISSGNLRKVIMVRQKGKGTANCYAVSDDGNQMYQDLVVTVKGNGEEGLISDGKLLNDRNPFIAPTNVKIIWETAQGLIKLETNPDGSAKISTDGIVRYKVDLTKKNSDIMNSNQNIQGGNALIGGFDANNELLWSWHIWVCPDLDTSKDGVIDPQELAAQTENWSTGYIFMDRNLGAISKKPGLASLGLLYQWGRKDPFIGMGSITENANKMATVNLTGFPWGNLATMNVEDARKKPTTLSGGALEGTDYALLWGTDKGFEADGEKDAGNKTIYDPCPVGYRVPPVASVVFKSGTSSSETTNWAYNNIYWPYLQSYNSYNGANNYKNDTDSYGFWVNLTSGGSKPTGLPYYTTTNKNNATTLSNATWLPISGAYDGNMNSFTKIDNQWSTTVNSIVWTNSSVTINSIKRPGALFLHGTEDWSLQHNTAGSGRHIHKLKEAGTNNGLYAKPSHAGSVRCIKDEKSSIQNSIKVPATITLEANIGSTVTATLVSITETWEVVDPGASWFTMTPDEGGTGSAQTITFKATEENTGAQRQAILKIRFSNNEERQITVIQKPSSVFSANPTNLTFAGYRGNPNSGNRPDSKPITITSDGVSWSAARGSNSTWLQVSTNNSSFSSNISNSSATTLYIRADFNGPSSSSRSGSIILTAGSKTITINVTQGTNKQ